MPCWWGLTRSRQLSTAASVRVIWLCGTRQTVGCCSSVSLAFIVFLPLIIPSLSEPLHHFSLKDHLFLKVPTKQIFLNIISKYNVWNIQNSNFAMPTKKIVDFTSAQRWAILPLKMVMGLKPNLLRFDVNLFTPGYWGEIQRLRKCQVILKGIVSPIYREVLAKILWRKMKKMLKNLLHTNWRHTLISRYVLAARFKEIAQLCAHAVKSTIFMLVISNFGVVYFKRYIFILCGKNFRFMGSAHNRQLGTRSKTKICKLMI